MKNKISCKRGFTLIELLVVVLIIGILAAVALPQYQKAVDKTRASEVVQLISSLEKAVDLWFLENSTSAQNICLLGRDCADELSINIPCQPYDQDNNSCRVNKHYFYVNVYSNGSADAYAYLDDTVYDYVIIAAQRDSNGKWTHTCGYSHEIGNRGKAICKGLQGYEVVEGFDI